MENIRVTFHKNLLRLACICMAVLPCYSSAQSPLTFGLLRLNENPAAYESFEQYMEQYLGQGIEIMTYRTGTEVMEAIRAGELDFAIITPIAFILLDREVPLRPILTLNTELSPEFEFLPIVASAVFVLDERSDINAIGDIKGKSVIGLSEDSLGGWLAAKREWTLQGIEEADFSEISLNEDNQKILQSVCSRQTDVGVMSASTFSRLKTDCDKTLRILADPSGMIDEAYPLEKSSRFYPSASLVAVGNLSESLVSEISLALQSIEPGDNILDGLGVGRFTPPLSFLSVRELMVDLELGPYKGINDVSIKLVLDSYLEWIVAALLILISVLGFNHARTVGLLKKLQNSEDFRKRVFEESHLPIVILKGETLEYLIVNRAACTIYGVKAADQMLGKTPLDFSPEYQPGDIPSTLQAAEVVEQAKRTGLNVFQWDHIRSDGKKWTAQNHLMPFYSDGQLFFQGTQVDITERLEKESERKLLEKELQHSQRMDSIGRLAGAISHDFNNLLTVINGYCEILTFDADENSLSSEQKYIRQIALAGKQAAELTGQLLTFSSKQVTNPVTLNLAEVLKETISMFENLLGEDIKIISSISADAGFTKVDPGQMNQVLMNLLVNSRDAMPEGGKLSISLEKVHLDGQQASALELLPDDYLRLTIADTGTGISEHVSQHIFEPFFSTKGDKGTGLGLSTVYGIIKQHGGSVSLFSEPGQGASFFIYLPCAVADQQSQPLKKKAATSSNQEGGTILLVEDQGSVRELTRHILISGGYEIIDTPTAEQALLIANSREVEIHLLISDVVLESMNGGELAEKFQLIRPGVPVLLMSGYSDDEISRRGVRQQKYPFIAKPYSPADLLLKVKEVMSTADLRFSKESPKRYPEGKSAKSDPG